MINKKFIIAFLLCFLIFNLNNCYASDIDTYVRVRIRKPRINNEKLELSGCSNIDVYDFVNDKYNLLFSIDNNIKILLDTYYDLNYETVIEGDCFNIEESESKTNKSNDNRLNLDKAIIGPYHVRLSDYVFDNYNLAISNVNKLNKDTKIKCYPYYCDGNFYLLSGFFVYESDANNYLKTLKNNGIKSELIYGKDKNVVIYDNQYNILGMYKDNYNIFFENSNKDKEILKIDNKSYRGKIAFKCDENKLISINKLNMKEYLYGVIPNEISPSWPNESIKAQVIASRTYSAVNIDNDSKYGYDVSDSQGSQVYRGYESENNITNIAVDDTDGLMIYYHNELIIAFFHSTSGGSTENSENVWISALPYLRSVDDPFSSISPYTYWDKTISKECLIDRIKEKYPNISDIYNIYVKKTSDNNRVLECIVNTDVGDIVLTKEKIRSVIGYDVLLSSWFDIETDCGKYLISGKDFQYSDENYNVLDALISNINVSNGYENNDNSNDNLSQNTNNMNDNNSNENKEENEVLNENTKTGNNKGNNVISLVNKYIISSDGIDCINDNVEKSILSNSKLISFDVLPDEFIFHGRGWGHGVGMSQYGAKKMAEEGYTFQQILKYYYTGVEIK